MRNTIAQSVGVDIAKDTLDVHLHPAGKVAGSPTSQGLCRPDRLARRFRGRPRRVRAHRRLSPRLRAPPGRGRPAAGQDQSAPSPPLRRSDRPSCQACPRAGQRPDPGNGRGRCGHARPLRRPPRAAGAARGERDPRRHEGVAWRRRALVKDRVAAQNRDHTHRSALLERQARERLRQIERQIAALEAALHAELAADPALKARFDILVSIPGVGEATAFAMLIEMPELGALEHKCAASLAGLAPIARDSGQHRGKRFIRGGRAPLRQALTCRPWSRSASTPP